MTQPAEGKNRPTVVVESRTDVDVGAFRCPDKGQSRFDRVVGADLRERKQNVSVVEWVWVDATWSSYSPCQSPTPS